MIHNVVQDKEYKLYYEGLELMERLGFWVPVCAFLLWSILVLGFVSKVSANAETLQGAPTLSISLALHVRLVSPKIIKLPRLTVRGRRSTQYWKVAGSSNGSISAYHKREISQGPYQVVWPLPTDINKDSVYAEFSVVYDGIKHWSYMHKEASYDDERVIFGEEPCRGRTHDNVDGEV
ncbi:hypothetical protein CJ030_MR4G023694 [Morella rubra]|uniref:Uncharacterized protein n=1 Tax=Morella rubra TaxID=262757 RepID=A0A6A1VVG1_9ROSI|nr:hypothetical protein CJ030_MR4G023694 [Morella rubra]